VLRVDVRKHRAQRAVRLVVVRLYGVQQGSHSPVLSRGVSGPCRDALASIPGARGRSTPGIRLERDALRGLARLPRAAKHFVVAAAWRCQRPSERTRTGTTARRCRSTCVRDQPPHRSPAPTITLCLERHCSGAPCFHKCAGCLVGEDERHAAWVLRPISRSP
jgi:hypothetical protein